MFNQPFRILLFCILLSTAAFSQAVDSTQLYYQWVNKPTQPAHLPAGYFYFLDLANAFIKNADTLYAVDARLLAAIASLKLGALDDSEHEAVEALQWLDALPAPPEIKNSRYSGLYNHLGMLYRNKSHFDKAYDYYSRALTYIKTTSDSSGQLNNRGNVYLDIKNYALAEQDFRQAIDLGRQAKDTVFWARALNNLGVLQLKQDNREGLETIQKALQIRELINDLEGMYSSNRHLALFTLSERDTATALKYVSTTLDIARELNSASFLLESLSILMDLKSDPLVNKFKTLNDSINRAKQEEQNLYAAMRFDVEKEMLNTQRAELLLEKERSQKVLIQILAVLVLALLVLAIILILSRIKRIRHKEVFKTENRISKKVHDELANDVYMAMVKMQLEKERDEDLLDDLEHIYNKSRDISKEYQGLDVKIPFDEIISDLLSSYQSDTIKIIRRDTKRIDWNTISEVKKNSIYRVLQELMTNMKKHSEATLVAVTFSQSRREIKINYSDNGVGSLLKKQNGLQNAEFRIFALNGSIIFETQPNKGFKVTITL